MHVRNRNGQGVLAIGARIERIAGEIAAIPRPVHEWHPVSADAPARHDQRARLGKHGGDGSGFLIPIDRVAAYRRGYSVASFARSICGAASRSPRIGRLARCGL
jgi:hypothetical protein